MQCVIGKGKVLSLESISPIKDPNEITNHWLNIITGKCIRKLGALSEDELKGAEAAETNKIIEKRTDLSTEEKTALETIEKMKRDKMELSYEEIFDQIGGDFEACEKTLKAMVQKGVLKITSENHYDIY